MMTIKNRAKSRAMVNESIYIQHAVNEGEFVIPETRYKADGYCKETNTIYEFHGTIYHGDPRICNPNDFNYLGNKYCDLYENTLQREAKIKELNYNLVVMWEHDYDLLNCL
jgi:hypothetical protein